MHQIYLLITDISAFDTKIKNGRW